MNLVCYTTSVLLSIDTLLCDIKNLFSTRKTEYTSAGGGRDEND